MVLTASQNYDDPSRPDYRPLWWMDSVSHWGDTLQWTKNLRRNDFKDRYLTKVPGELTEDRETRVERTNPEPWFKDAVKDKASLFGQFSLSEDAPQSLKDSENNVDLQGTSLKQWALGPLRAFFRDGGAILGADITTQVVQGSRRPRLLWVPLKDIYCPEYRNIDGIDVWSKVSIRRVVEAFDENSGKIEQKNEYWVYELDDSQACFVAVYREDDDAQFSAIQRPRYIVGANNEPLQRLPFTDSLTVLGSLSMTEEDQIFSPLDDLLTLNIRHFNQQSRLDTVEAKTAVPKIMLYSRKEDVGSAFYSGSGKVGVFDPEDRGEFLELKGESLPQLRQSVYDTAEAIKERDNRLFSAGVAKTATEAVIENAKAKASLPAMIEAVESAFQDAFAIWETFANPAHQEEIGGIDIDVSVLDVPADPSQIPYYLQTQTIGVPALAIQKELIERGLFSASSFERVELQASALPTDPNEVIQ